MIPMQKVNFAAQNEIRNFEAKMTGRHF